MNKQKGAMGEWEAWPMLDTHPPRFLSRDLCSPVSTSTPQQVLERKARQRDAESQGVAKAGRAVGVGKEVDKLPCGGG